MKNPGPGALNLAELGDFTVDRRVIAISAIGIAIGVFSCGVAYVLLKLITLFTNIFFFATLDLVERSPAQHSLGIFVAYRIPL